MRLKLNFNTPKRIIIEGVQYKKICRKSLISK